MSLRTRTLFSITALATLAACSTENTPTSITAGSASRDGSPSTGVAMRFEHAMVCPTAGPNAARCHAWVRIDPSSGRPLAAGGPSGYNPADLRSAYNLTASGSTSQTIAIVDAYDDPNAESDLAVYRGQFGMTACTTANGCFRKVDQNGGSSYPSGDTGWAEEISLDLDMASAICPGCKILLVEAKSAAFTDLAAAVDRAVTLGATVVSNSYGGTEFSSEGSATYNGHFNHPGVAITVSSGDSGFGVEFPAASQYVTAVGGTSLSRSSGGRGWTESAWSGAGSGCSRYIARPTWQNFIGDCPNNRSVADVSAVADPNTGVSVYDSYGVGGWLVFGGTSVSSPIIAAVYALAGNAGSVNYGQNPYLHTSSLFDVTSGINGHCHRTPTLCAAGIGWDGPTGLGTPNGLGAF
jgi:subtilase family serine protease